MIAPMKTVPQNSGIEPKAPDEPAWSARSAVCGLQFVPNRNSVGLTSLKKRRLSNSSDRTMPSVVRIAISDAPSEQAHQPALDAAARAEIDADAAQRQERRRPAQRGSRSRRRSRRSGSRPRHRRGASSVDSGLKPASRSPAAISRASARIVSRCISKAGSSARRARPAPPGRPSSVWIGAQTARNSSAGSAAQSAT